MMKNLKIIVIIFIVLFSVAGASAYFISEANHNNGSNGSVNVSNNGSIHSGNNTTDKLENNTFNESNKDTVSVNKTVDSKNIKNNKESVSPKYVSPVNKTVANHKSVVSNKKSTNPAKSVDSKDIGYKKSLAIAKKYHGGANCSCGGNLKVVYYHESSKSRFFLFDYSKCNDTQGTGIEVMKSDGFTCKA